EKVAVESLGWGGLVRGAVLMGVALVAPVVGAALLGRGTPLPGFSAAIGGGHDRAVDWAGRAGAWLLVVVAVLAVQTALGLVFDPRYRDFPFAALTAGAVPFLLVGLVRAGGVGVRGAAETLAAAVLGLSAVFVLLNETPANWQAAWLAAAFVALALTLLRVRVAPG
ncbi:hypothetical protein CH340_23890, partial [Rhodoplanes serenus]